MQGLMQNVLSLRPCLLREVQHTCVKWVHTGVYMYIYMHIYDRGIGGAGTVACLSFTSM